MDKLAPTILSSYPSTAQRKEKENYTYIAPWLISSISFSCRSDQLYRLAITSFIEEGDNKGEILKLDQNLQELEKVGMFTLRAPATKVMWIPDLNTEQPDIFATSEDSLKIWEVMETGVVELKHEFKSPNYPDFPAPLVSFDWCPTNLDLIVTGSIDSTCAVWNLKKQTLYSHLIAHDKEVYDVSFSPDENVFATAGGDCSLRQFDLRDIGSATVLLEAGSPLLRLDWNRKDPNYIACSEMESNVITIVDIRKPLNPVSRLVNHKKNVNALCWSPATATSLCTVGDDCKALIWDITDLREEINEPLLEYTADGEIASLNWSILQPEWLGITMGKKVELLHA